jgi:sterol desaturase/sphingolipid hydroxylase (fatty acid hydroxylase superfamily)
MSYLLGITLGLISVFSFVRTNNNLQEKYYCIMADAKDKWKINTIDISSLKYKDWRFPLFSKLSKYTKQQRIHYLESLTMIVGFQTLTVQLYLKGKTRLHLDHYNLVYFPLDVVWCLFLNSTIFYCYHRLAHTKYIYKYIHRYHHAFQSPEIYDSLIGHPLDHTCSAICQIFPMFVYRMHLLSFLGYSSIVSLTGIYEHSGIKIVLPFYSTLDHHIHHKYPNKNYGAGFPILVWDRLFGSYQEQI